MLTPKDLSGILGMMPSFATPDAVDVRATQTIAVNNLKEGVDRIIKDGVDNIATTGTYGECYNLLWEEFETLTVAAVDAVKKRVPLFIGCTSPNPREVVKKMNFVKDSGADGVLLGVPESVDDFFERLHAKASLYGKSDPVPRREDGQVPDIHLGLVGFEPVKCQVCYR